MKKNEITANDQGFILPPGTRLALIDEAGRVVDAGPELSTQLFHVAGDQYLAAVDRLLGEKSANHAAIAAKSAA
ncbi:MULTISPECIES: hypothetical protein [unclassified Oceanobacter]|uniref:hypothetical protein n=1 Tax=unclassified Oceanobacter TaxID=2620260 RepID=UPI00273733F0|nr:MULTISPECIES: hypothetical protein [unclassified Oceanobacter]MDP2610060.1 hypothetical protein [Oceanobacter sp. 1_MG-2023]MDP2613304.1 hypothetical protein [Oceanobacter sp. 2_MG-2023]